MVKFLKNIYHMISKRAMYKPVLSFSTVVAFQESELGKPKSSLKLENMREKWSHKHLLQQSSVLSMESCSVTLTQTVVAVQALAESYCANMRDLAALLSLTSDGLPIAYTMEELYDRVVQLKMQIKLDKQQLIELQTLFSYVRKMMDSVAETSFLVGAEYASLQASSRLAEAENQVKLEVDRVVRMEEELLLLEKESIVKWGKEKEKEKAKLADTTSSVELSVEDVKKQVENLKPVVSDDIPATDEIKISAIEELNADDGIKQSPLFSFLDNSDEHIKITVKDDNSFENESDVSKSEDGCESDKSDESETSNETPRYKFPTF